MKWVLWAFAMTAIFVVVVGCMIALVTAANDPTSGQELQERGGAIHSGTLTSPGPSGDEALAAELGASGWSDDAAQAVVGLNREWFAIQREENPAGFARQSTLLKGLGKHPRLMPFLAAHPETAGLLISQDDPFLIVDSLDGSSDEDYELIAGCYVQQPDPAAARALAIGLKENRELVCTLKRRGLIAAEVLFVFDRGIDAAWEYEAWIRDTLRSRIEGSDEQLASFANFLMYQRSEILKRLREKPDFRKRFRQELWPALGRAAGSDKGMLELYIDEPRVWDVLALSNGESLLRHAGMLSIDLLYGFEEIKHQAYPEELHPHIRDVLLNGEGPTIDALFRYRGEPLFRRLIARPLTSETRRAALHQLTLAGPDYPSLLARYDRLSDEALAEEVGPPPAGLITWVPFYYTVYEVPKKLMQGRDPSTMEWFQAICDPAFLVIDITSGGGGKIARDTITRGVRKVAEKVVENGTPKVMKITLRNTARELAKKSLGKKIAENLGEREGAQWMVTGSLTEIQRTLRNAAGRVTTFEITKPVQFIFRYSGVGRTTWKRWTKMEPRLFMRGDAKVYIRLSNLAGAVVGSRAAAFIERTGKDLALGAIVESEPGQKVTQTGVEKALSAKEQIDLWHQQISAWWLLNASNPGVDQ